jgi:hypothetical protein
MDRLLQPLVDDHITAAVDLSDARFTTIEFVDGLAYDCKSVSVARLQFRGAAPELFDFGLKISHDAHSWRSTLASRLDMPR